jgi:pimeloyl-ACP methyl ester carboxylesterase
MQKQNNFGKILLAAIACGMFFIANYANAAPNEETETYIDINEDTTWRKEDDLHLNKTVYINEGATLTIEKGADIVFDIDTDGTETYMDISGGRIVANGTQDEPISISASEENKNKYYLLGFSGNNNDPSFLRYVDISNGGISYDGGGWAMLNKIFGIFTAKAYFDDGSPAVYFESGKVHMENCRFENNAYADVGIYYNEYGSSTDTDNYLEIINSNFQINGDSFAVKTEMWCLNAGYECQGKFVLKNNWYGNSAGPKIETNPDSYGKEISGDVLVDGWRKKDLITDPAIIVPGIMGSEKSFLGLTLDPISRTYDDLVDSFEMNGYEKDVNLFTFPYNWRKSNIETAKLLQEKIQSVVDDTKVSKTDIVAHSMGGLIAREYIESNYYQNNIDQLIALGTPHRGAPEAYLKWEAGEGFFTVLEKLGRHHLRDESQHAGYDSLFEYIQNEVPSVGELLPDYDYLFDVEKGEMRSYFDNYPRNEFLENINKAENVEKMKNVDFTNIVGKIGLDVGEEKNSTISRIDVVESEKENLWENGMPEDFYNEETDQGLEYGVGDEAVPLFSAESIPFNTQIKIDASHGNLPTEAQCVVLEELAEIKREDCVYVDKFRVGNILLFNLFSPIDVQIVAPDGKRIGKNFETGEIFDEIEGAYYTGYATENEMVAIPNPQDGKYKILTQGTGEGEYAIEAVKISQDEQGGVSEIVSRTQGTAQPNQEEEISLNLNENEITIQNQDTQPPLIFIHSPNQEEYLNDQIIPVEYEVVDDKTSAEKIQKEIIFEKSEFDGNEIDLSLMNLGIHRFEIIVRDEAQNQMENRVIFKTKTDPSALKNNIRHYYDLKFIKGRSEVKVLTHGVESLERYFNLIERIKNNPQIPQKTKNKLIAKLEKVKNEYIQEIIFYINRKMKNEKIDSKIGELLIEGFGSLR